MGDLSQMLHEIRCVQLKETNGSRQLPCNTCPISSAVLGNAWANENMFTAAEGIIWFRYHNYVASRLREEHPGWSDEALFQNARKTVVATFQVRRRKSARCEGAAVICTLAGSEVAPGGRDLTGQIEGFKVGGRMHHPASRFGELTSARAILREGGTSQKKKESKERKINLILATFKNFLQHFGSSHHLTANKLADFFYFFLPPLQNIALYEWLPANLGDKKLPPYAGKNSPPGARVHVV